MACSGRHEEIPAAGRTYHICRLPDGHPGYCECICGKVWMSTAPTDTPCSGPLDALPNPCEVCTVRPCDYKEPKGVMV